MSLGDHWFQSGPYPNRTETRNILWTNEQRTECSVVERPLEAGGSGEQESKTEPKTGLLEGGEGAGREDPHPATSVSYWGGGGSEVAHGDGKDQRKRT